MNVFSRIYANNEWNGIETRSGPGSHREPTRRVAAWLKWYAETDVIDCTLNIGCGEDWWMPHLPGYLGVDVAPEAIEVARRRNPKRRYQLWDDAPIQDRGWSLVIVRDVVQHLSLSEGVQLMETAFLKSAYAILASTYVGTVNEDIVTGDAYRPNLQAEPFNFGPPFLLIHDGYEYHDGDRLRDPAKMLGLWLL